jgi:predicted transcriptional regulator
MAEKSMCTNSVSGRTLHEYVKQMDRSFQEMLFDLIDESGMSDVECYKKANVDKRTFSKIKSNKNYKPSKQTAIAFAIALQLDLEGTQDLLATVGFTLSRSNVFDKIIRYFIQNGNYNIFEINEALFEFDQSLLGV